MRLTSLDIKRQEFEREFRGYNADAVDSFLNTVATQWEEMQEERRRLENDLRDMRGRLEHYQKVEEALQEALQTARVNAKKTQENAEHKAKNIVQEAELRAQGITKEAEQERYNLKRELARLTNRRAEVSARLRAFLLSEMEVLASFEGDDPVGFIKLLPSEERARRGRKQLPQTAALESPFEDDDYAEIEQAEAPKADDPPPLGYADLPDEPKAQPLDQAPPPAKEKPLSFDSVPLGDDDDDAPAFDQAPPPAPQEAPQVETFNERFAADAGTPPADTFADAEPAQPPPAFGGSPFGVGDEDDPFPDFPTLGDDIMFEQSPAPAEPEPMPFGKKDSGKSYSWSPDDELGGKRTPPTAKTTDWLGDDADDLSDDDFSRAGTSTGAAGSGWTNTPLVASDDEPKKPAPTQEKRNPAGSREEIDRIRRILDDLD